MEPTRYQEPDWTQMTYAERVAYADRLEHRAVNLDRVSEAWSARASDGRTSIVQVAVERARAGSQRRAQTLRDLAQAIRFTTKEPMQ